MNPSEHEEEFFEAQVAVIATRLIVTGVLWCIALALIDRVSAPVNDPYVANTRLGLWLFLAEVLVGTYSVRYTAPTSFPIVKRAAFVVAESCSQAWRMATYVTVNLAIRWLIVTVLTGLAIYLIGSGSLTRLAAIAPSLSYAVAFISGISSIATPPIIRGTHIGSYREAVHRAATIVLATRLAMVQRLQDNGFDLSELKDVQVLIYPWGGVDLPASVLDPHYLILGTVGSGKTLCIRMLLKPALLPFGELKNRALIYDGKREYYPLLLGLGIPAEQILILNPADLRCIAWDIAKDVRNRDDAVNITHILIAEDKNANENPFFIRAVRALVTEVMMALHSLSPGKWRLIDLINAMRTPKLLKRVLKTTKEGKEVRSRYFTQAVEAVGGIISTIDARFISDYETIARVWARCERSISLTEWIENRSVILLGYDANRQAVDRINQAMFQRAAQLICSLPESGEQNRDHTWVVLDEVRFTGKLPMLPELISFGRTKNAHCVLAPQDIDGLIDVYGEHRANEMLALCGNIGVLRLISPKTRDWAAKLFGDSESWEIEENWSNTVGGSGGTSSWSSTRGWSKRKVKRESVLPSDFFNLPPTNRQNGMNGFFATPAMKGAWRAEIPPDFIDAHLPPIDPEALPFIPRSNSAVDPVRWTPEDEQRFTQPPENPTPPSDDDPSEADEDQPKKAPPKDKKPVKGRTDSRPQDGEKAGEDPLPNW